MLVLGQFPSSRDTAGVTLVISGIARHRQPTAKGDWLARSPLVPSRS